MPSMLGNCSTDHEYANPACIAGERSLAAPIRRPVSTVCWVGFDIEVVSCLVNLGCESAAYLFRSDGTVFAYSEACKRRMEQNAAKLAIRMNRYEFKFGSWRSSPAFCAPEVPLAWSPIRVTNAGLIPEVARWGDALSDQPVWQGAPTSCRCGQHPRASPSQLKRRPRKTSIRRA